MLYRVIILLMYALHLAFFLIFNRVLYKCTETKSAESYNKAKENHYLFVKIVLHFLNTVSFTYISFRY